jgi:hypothetical protein
VQLDCADGPATRYRQGRPRDRFREADNGQSLPPSPNLWLHAPVLGLPTGGNAFDVNLRI